MNRTQKREIVERLTERLQRTSNLYLTDFTGIGVQPMTELRRKLRAAGGEYVVVKNTLAHQALASAEVTGLDDSLTGPTAFVFAGPDPLSAAKVLSEFQKEHDVLTVKVGVVDGRKVTAEEVRRLATLPSREQLLAELGGAMQGPMQGLAVALTSLLSQFVGAVEALRAQRAGA